MFQGGEINTERVWLVGETEKLVVGYILRKAEYIPTVCAGRYRRR
jgi:hypothetical protein